MDGVSHSEEPQREGLEEGPPLLGTLEDMLKKASGMGISIGAPLKLRKTWNLEGGSYTGDFKKCMKQGSSNGASPSEGIHESNLEGGLLY
jgi:hypothetical protein